MNTRYKIFSLSLFIFTLTFSGLFFSLSAKKVEAVKFSAAGATKEIVALAASCVGTLLGFKIAGKTTAKAEGVSGVAVPVVNGGTEATTTQQTAKEACIDAVAVGMARVVIKKITESTINWINSGFEGDPLYVRDPASFFKGIANEQIGGLQLAIESSGAPFARSLAEGLILANITDFQAKIKYNLDSYLGSDREVQYRLDFAAGGWDAWLLQTQYPQNNPAGARFLLADEMTKRLQGTDKAVAEFAQDEIDQGLGFLSLKECVDPTNYQKPPAGGFQEIPYADPFQGMTPEELAELTNQERFEIENAAVDAWAEANEEAREDYEAQHTCKKWETRTPGTVIEDHLKTTLGSSIRQAELADEISKSVGLIADALVGQLIGEGLDALSTSSSSSVSVGNLSSYGTNTSSGTQIGTSTSWTQQGDSIYTIWEIDSLIQFQKDYLAVLNQYDTYINQSVLPKLYELDFCVPGPRPGFEDSARTRGEELISSFPEVTRLSAGIFTVNTMGLPIEEVHPSMQDAAVDGKMKGMFRDIFNHVINVTSEKWFNTMSLLNLPSINVANMQEHKKVATYKANLESNQTEKLETQASLTKLEYIKAQMTGLPSPASGITPTTSQQDKIDQLQRVLDQMTPYIAKENTISSVENDIEQAQVDFDILGDNTKGLIKQCIDEVAIMDQSKNIRFRYPDSLLDPAIQANYPPIAPAHTVNPMSGTAFNGPSYILPVIYYVDDDCGGASSDPNNLNLSGNLNLDTCSQITGPLEYNLGIY